MRNDQYMNMTQSAFLMQVRNGISSRLSNTGGRSILQAWVLQIAAGSLSRATHNGGKCADVVQMPKDPDSNFLQSSTLCAEGNQPNGAHDSALI